MKRLILFAGAALFSVCTSTVVRAQEKYCGSTEMTQKLWAKDPSLYEKFLEESAIEKERDRIAFANGYKEGDGKAMPPVYVVPVVFHIIHEGGTENISDAQIYDAMRCINEDYRKLNADNAATISAFTSISADIEINFVLARKDPSGNCTNGIDRIYSSQTNIGDDGSKLNDWPRNKYLNIWVVRTITSGAAAYAYTPGTVSSSASAGNDGVICLSTYVGSIGTSTLSHSHTLSHEIGHYLNLQHCWGPTNNPGCDGTATSGPCYSTGPFPPAGPIDNCDYDDFVSDTPNTRGWTSCNLSGATCGSPVDNVQNFMEYSYCSTMFTAGQKSRMRTAITSSTASRNNLWTSANLTATGVSTPSVLCQADFQSSDPSNIVCQGDSLTFTDLSWNGNPTSWSWVFPGGTPSTSTDSMPTIVYNTPGVYDVTLTVTDGSGSVNTTKTGYVTVFANTAAYSATFYSEGFEGSAIPNADWNVFNLTPGTNTWTQTTAAAASGTKSVRILNTSTSDGNVDELVSPTIDMTAMGGSTVNMTYKVANAQRTSTTADKLQVYVSSNCGKTWSLRQTVSGVSLSTGGVTTSSFVPTASQWATKVVNLSLVASQPSVMVKFKFTSNGGNNIYIDDINISSTAGIDELASNLGFNVYPNPAEENTVIAFALTESHNTDIRIFDVLGQEMTRVFSGNLAAGDHQYKIADHTTLASGVYFVKLTLDGRAFTQKLIVK
jgi:PKD repeat protein